MYENEKFETTFKMNENTSQKRFADDRDILFGIPDTGIRVSWDFSAGSGTSENDKKGTHLRPITPKPVKYPPKVYRRRCLNQIKLPAEGDDAFAEEMLSLVRVSRKSIMKASPGVSPKGRSPRTLRTKAKPSPRQDDFHFLLNDSTDADEMIRCSQITEAALREAENESPVAKRVSSAKRLALSRGVASPLSRNVASPQSRKVGSPLSRKKLLDAIQKSPLPPRSVKSEPKSAESADQCNNNVETSANGLVDKEPRRMQLQLPFGVVPITPRQGNSVAAKVKAELEIKTSPADPADDLDDGMDFDLSPHLLELLDGHVEGPDKQLVPKVEPGGGSEEDIPTKPQASVKPETRKSPPGKPSTAKPQRLTSETGTATVSRAPQAMPPTTRSNSALSLSQSKQQLHSNATSTSSNQSRFQQGAGSSLANKSSSAPSSSASTLANKNTPATNQSRFQQGAGTSLANNSSSAPSSSASTLANKNTPATNQSRFQPGAGTSLANKNSPSPSDALSILNKNTLAANQARLQQAAGTSLANKSSSTPSSSASSLATKTTPATNQSRFQQGASSVANKNSPAPPDALSILNKNSPATKLSRFQHGASSLANKVSSAPPSDASSANKNSLANKSNSAPSSGAGASALANKNSVAPSPMKPSGPLQGAPSTGASSLANKNSPGFQGASSGPPKSSSLSSLSLKHPVPKQQTPLPAKSGTPSLSQLMQGAIRPSDSLSRPSPAVAPAPAPAPVPGRSSQPTPKQNAPPVQSSVPARQCTRAEIERKRQEALRKLKLRSQSK